METSRKPPILCVDDEPNVLRGLELHLRRRYEVRTATSGAEALESLAEDGDVAVVVSDMRMPGMDGATFLGRVRTLLPDTARILLTGHSDVDSAIKAVNEGQLFRFLTKPCQPALLLGAIEAGVQQHELLGSERVLLEQTLRGSVKALTDVLALTSPLCFGRATRLKGRVSELAAALALEERWQVEVAAMLSQLAVITLPSETVEKLYHARDLTREETRMVEQLAQVNEQILGSIPRLEGVREILAWSARPPGRGQESSRARDSHLARCAQVLRIVADLDTLETQGHPVLEAFEVLRRRTGAYDPGVLDAYAEVRGRTEGDAGLRLLSVDGLRVGMLLMEDIRLATGALLAARGFEVTESFLARVRNFRDRLEKGEVQVRVGTESGGAATAA